MRFHFVGAAESCEHGEIDEAPLLAGETFAAPAGAPAVLVQQVLKGLAEGGGVVEGGVDIFVAQDFAAAFEQFDFVVTPTSPTVAFELGARTDDPLAMYLSDYCTVPMPLAGIPAISIPAGLAPPDDGGPELPVGFQIAGPAFSENGMLDAAYALEQAIGFDASPPDSGGGG